MVVVGVSSVVLELAASDLGQLGRPVADPDSAHSAVEQVRSEEGGVDVVGLEHLVIQSRERAGYRYFVVLRRLEHAFAELRHQLGQLIVEQLEVLLPVLEELLQIQFSHF
eukprot:CAMPEP_0170489008 /NCGR_PEP_ID=MMETSP0208-20121228/7434_1 /TAXON_ID=197538 /ORGANISM="Strombidium inclinatum, Strain S3" /LENGTH=109 /DNA_ID=CAMNT_0010763759 /DNA_START=144 /DNA_END=473 /DNA_ORIENTATION=-